jgi:hypothetical protein
VDSGSRQENAPKQKIRASILMQSEPIRLWHRRIGHDALNFAEKILSVVGPIATINLLPSPDQAVEALLFLSRSRHVPGGSPLVPTAPHFSGTKVSAGATGICDMRQFGSLLRSTRSRIGRVLAQVIAIAAASLPVAGA